MFSKCSNTELKKFDDSHIDKLKKVVNYDDKEEIFIEDTCCVETAENVFFLLTSKSAFFSYKHASVTSANRLFFKDNYNTQYLFLQSERSEHSVFHIEFDGNAHALVVEKETHKKRTEYRIYQSWIGEFTLQDWLKNKGKNSYSQAELISFIQNIILQLAKQKNKSGWFNFFCCSKKTLIKSISVKITKLPFNPCKLEKNYDRIYNSVNKRIN